MRLECCWGQSARASGASSSRVQRSAALSLSGAQALLVASFFVILFSEGFFNACMALIMERFSEPSRSRHLGSAVGLGHADQFSKTFYHCLLQFAGVPHRASGAAHWDLCL